MSSFYSLFFCFWMKINLILNIDIIKFPHSSYWWSIRMLTFALKKFCKMHKAITNHIIPMKRLMELVYWYYLVCIICWDSFLTAFTFCLMASNIKLLKLIIKPTVTFIIKFTFLFFSAKNQNEAALFPHVLTSMEIFS